ncbi:coiled-coil domain-containing protein SCD2 isoform X1 [Brachypodium distachyon]|uniref:coiled-coil domain-containing protein SCD2 isoform X1 n=1 Tax=Brachypodium distachyon TaxID=15368 RepID=UPI00052FEA48|nr:coiled-coil domain-containing protein SCD2 isoform X1 [Brachypodium distachyon]|eukprot:XP_010237694.1 coiled-coil domain-containing protein SCD2 isoform X1 [Brachypodium distachyon]
MPMDAPRGGGGGGPARRTRPTAAASDPRRAASAREAMLRMEEMMLAHAGAAGEFSIIVDAPLPTLQRYRRNPTPPTAPASGSSSSPARRGMPQGGAAAARDEVPVRLRREGSATEALDDVEAARSWRRVEAGVPSGDGGARRARPEGVFDEEEEAEAPVRMRDPRGTRRESGRVSAPPARAVEEKPAVAAAAAVEEETPLQKLARGGRSSSANRAVEATQVAEPLAERPTSRRSRREDAVSAVVHEPPAVEVESVGWRSSGGSEDGEDEAVALPKPLAAIVTGVRSRSNSPAISRNSVNSAAANRPQSTGRSSFAPPVGANVRPLQAVDMPNGTPRERRTIYPDPTFAQSTRSRDSHDSSTLTEEVEMLKDENVNLLEKLGLAEEKFRQSEARTKELEKQVANLGDGLSMEVKLMKRREEMLVRKEQEIRKALISKNDKSEEITTLQQQLQSASEKAEVAERKLKEAESETKALRTMTQRMILSKEEMEEVVMKRCWLARYWGLAVQYGIYPDISISKYEYWSSFAPLPLEYVTAAGQRAKDGSHHSGTNGLEETDMLVHDLTVTAGEGNIETMLAVDKGLKELAFLKVEDAVLIALAQHHRPNAAELPDPDIKSSGDEKFTEAFDLSKEEEEDVLFKQAWLIYFWRRAKSHNVEDDIAEERLQMWIDRQDQQPTSHDAVDVEQGMHELRKLGIEQMLWEFSRQEVNTAEDELSDAEDDLT